MTTDRSVAEVPCDRLIVATAMLRSLTILTPDPHIHDYEGAETVW